MLGEFGAIAILLGVVALVVWRLPQVDLGHDAAFRQRRSLNWVPLGLTYAFLYMGRYNLAAAKDIGALTQEQYGDVFGWGAMAYGVSFLLSGPLTDRLGGRLTILIAAGRSAMCNVGMGLAMTGLAGDPRLGTAMTLLYAANMHFQSYGAVSVVKVNSAWFHVRERGVYGGLFGVLISLGVYFAFDWGRLLAENLPIGWLFHVPAIVLAGWFALDLAVVRSSPADAGLTDFDVGDASSGQDGPPDPVWVVAGRMLTSPVILTIAAIEFCSGFLRNAIMHWYRDFAKGLGLTTGNFVYEHWGMLLCVAGITGGMFAGVISDRVFQSRRGPVAAVLYAMMLVGALAMVPLLDAPALVGPVVVVMSMAVIGVHGMLSGTASADFGGRRNAGVAVGLIDACVYFGTMSQSFLLGRVLPEKGTPEAADLANWAIWPWAMAPVALVGLLLAATVWNARPKAH